MASRSALVERSAWRSSTKGPWGMRYLPQAIRPKPRKKRPSAEGEPEDPGLPVLPVGGAEDAHRRGCRGRGTTAMAALRPLAGCRAASRRCGSSRLATGSGQVLVHRPFDRPLGPLVVWSLTTAPRSRTRPGRGPPTPNRRATKPSATGPTPPEGEAAGVGRVLDVLGHVGDDVAHLGVGQVAGEAGHVARAGPDGLGDLGGGGGAQRRGEGAEGELVTGAGDGVAGRAVEREQVGTDRPRWRPSGSPCGIAGADGVERVDEGRDLEGLLVAQLWPACGGPGSRSGSRPACGRSTPRSRPSPGPTPTRLGARDGARGLGAVAARAERLEQGLAGRDVGLRRVACRGSPSCRRTSAVVPARGLPAAPPGTPANATRPPRAPTPGPPPAAGQQAAGCDARARRSRRTLT